jgi:hypothetical protein
MTSFTIRTHPQISLGRSKREKRRRPKTRGKEDVLRAMEECGLRHGDWEDRLHWRLMGVERRCHAS